MKMMTGNLQFLKQMIQEQESDFLRNFFELIKFSLCLFISISAIFGFVMATQSFSLQALSLGFFVLVLASGCAALNNIQDREYDACFARTCNRVLVVNKLTIKTATVIAVVSITTGLLGLLIFFKGVYPFIFGIFALICYNFLYTPLKKKTLLFIIPGAMSGMLPPLIGWTAAGALATDKTIIVIMMVLGLWQIPHFFLTLLKSDIRLRQKQYPDFNNVFSRTDLKLQTLIWCGLYSLSMLFFLLFENITSFYLSLFIVLNAAGIILWTGVKLINSGKSQCNQAFAAINLSLLLFMGVVLCS